MATSHFKDGNHRLPVCFAAADIPTLYNSQTLRSNFETAQTARNHLRVNGDCELIAVLNGKDYFLENLWGMGEEQRRESFLRLAEIGFSVGTGATFSVTGRTTEGRLTPHAHNVAMLMRHHQVVDEINASGLFAVPNLYWLDNDEREIQRWSKWLIKNPQIRTISRDFTLTKNKQTVLAKLRELKHLLDLTGRAFHVLIIGHASVKFSCFSYVQPMKRALSWIIQLRARQIGQVTATADRGISGWPVPCETANTPIYFLSYYNRSLKLS